MRSLRSSIFAACLLAATPALAQQRPPAAVNPVTGGPVPAPWQALGNVLRGQNPPPLAQVGQPPLPTAIPPFTAPQDRNRGP
jgi:hypothetical protein